jgi:hypothetical protein
MTRFKMLRHRQPESLTELALRSIADFVYQMGQHCIKAPGYAVSENPEGRSFGNLSTDSFHDIEETSQHSFSSQVHYYNWNALQQFLQPGLPRILASKVSSYVLDALTHLINENECFCHDAVMIDHDPSIDFIDMLVLKVVQPHMSELVLSHYPDYLCLVLCKQLHRLSELKVLKIHAIPTKSIKLTVRDVVGSNIRSLRNLIVFSYAKHCTDSILRVLSDHCWQLEHLNVMFSKKVTNQSVESLKKFQNLKTLNIWGTSINRPYSYQLLDVLLKLEDFSSDQEFMLAGVTEHPLVLKSLRTTSFINLRDLTMSCLYLTRLTLYVVKCDLTCLAELTTLRELTVGTCTFSVIKTYLKLAGGQLTLLKLKEVYAVDMEFITYCTQLKTLRVSVCKFISHSGDLSSLHYKNLEHLTIRDSFVFLNNHEILLSAYTKLRTLKLLQHPVLRNEVIVDAITAGNWSQMEVVCFNECVEVEMLEYIVNNCYNLRKVIYKIAEDPDSPELQRLEQYVKQNNLDIEMVL